MPLKLRFSAALMVSAMFLAAGCDGDESPTAAADAPAAAPKAKSGYIVGRVTLADGKPITTPGVTFNLGVSGVSEAGEKVGFSPGVKADGTFQQKVPPGSYRIQYGKITVPFGDQKFAFDLAPQGTEFENDRDPTDGITQDFFWKTTGPKPLYSGKADVNNHTHWYGMQVGMRFAGYREDTKQPATPPPDGTKLIFTLKPAGTGKAIDGSDLKPITLERVWQSKAYPQNDDLGDFLAGDYAMTGVAKLPDGTEKPIVFQGAGDYPNFVPTGRVTLVYDNIIGGMAKQLMSWGLN